MEGVTDKDRLKSTMNVWESKSNCNHCVTCDCLSRQISWEPKRSQSSACVLENSHHAAKLKGIKDVHFYKNLRNDIEKTETLFPLKEMQKYSIIL